MNSRLNELAINSSLSRKKSQITKLKFQINPNDQNSKSPVFWALVIGIWNLFVIWIL
jgi:hypothetical protein